MFLGRGRKPKSTGKLKSLRANPGIKPQTFCCGAKTVLWQVLTTKPPCYPIYIYIYYSLKNWVVMFSLMQHLLFIKAFFKRLLNFKYNWHHFSTRSLSFAMHFPSILPLMFPSHRCTASLASLNFLFLLNLLWMVQKRVNQKLQYLAFYHDQLLLLSPFSTKISNIPHMREILLRMAGLSGELVTFLFNGHELFQNDFITYMFTVLLWSS